MTERISLTVQADATGRRLDAFLAEALPAVSRTWVGESIAAGSVLVNGRRAKPAQRIAGGDVIEGTMTERSALTATPQSIPLAIVYQDADLAVIDKPAGLVVHPAPGHARDTLANALVAHFPQAAGVGGTERPGIVHRLDRDTSGLIVVALSHAAHQALQRQIAQRTAGREYLALVRGAPRPAYGIIDVPVGRHPADRRRMAAHGIRARSARTAYRSVEELGEFTLVSARLETGRTHQIRVHFATIGHPLAGDSTYGGPRLAGLERQFLHAARLTVQSPSSGQEMTFESSVPSDLKQVLTELRGRLGR